MREGLAAPARVTGQSGLSMRARLDVGGVKMADDAALRAAYPPYEPVCFETKVAKRSPKASAVARSPGNISAGAASDGDCANAPENPPT